MGAESGMNSSVRDDRVALSDGAKALWGKTNRIDDSEWLPLYVHMVDSAAMASKIWDTWVPQGTKAVIVGDLGNDEVLARKLMIFMAGIHDIGKATPVFQAKSITFGPEAGSFAWKAERAGLPMIAGLRGTNHPHIPSQERSFLRDISCESEVGREKLHVSMPAWLEGIMAPHQTKVKLTKRKIGKPMLDWILKRG